MALPEISRPGIDAVDYGSRDFVEESKAIGAQLERFEQIRVSAAMELDSSIQDALRSTLSFQDRVKFDIGRIGDANVRALDQLLQEQVATNTQVTSDAAKFLQDRTIYLTKRLLEADAVEAQAIASELSDIREQAKRLADTERFAIEELAAVGSQGLGQVSLLREAFTKSLPTAESLVEGALGGGFVGKFAGNIIRVRKERKQRRAALDAEIAAREGIEEGGEAAEGVEGVGDVPDVAAPTGGIGGDAVEELLKCICASTSKTATIIAQSLQSDIEKEKEEERREERIVEALEAIDGDGDGDGVTQEIEKEKGGLLSTITGIASGLSMLNMGLRMIKNPRLAFRYFRMRLHRGVIKPLKANFNAIFGKGGILRSMLGGVFSTLRKATGPLLAGAQTLLSKVTGGRIPRPSALTTGPPKGALTTPTPGTTPSPGTSPTSSTPKPKKPGFFGRMFKKVKGVAKGAYSGIKAGAGAVYSAGKSAVKFVGAKAKLAKDLATQPLKFLTTKLGPKAGPFLGKIASKIPLIGSGIELLLTGADIMAIKNNPDMTAKQKKDAIGKRIGAGLGGIVGAVGGGALGTFIPIPVVGSILGAVLGDLAGRYVGDAIAGAIGGEKIYDALSFMLPEIPEDEAQAQPSGADGPQVDAGTGAGMGGQGSPITAPTPTTQTAGNFLRAGAAQNANTQLAMSAPGGTSVTNTAQSNTAMTTNQFMGGTLRTRNTHETISLVSQDRLAYGLA